MSPGRSEPHGLSAASLLQLLVSALLALNLTLVGLLWASLTSRLDRLEDQLSLHLQQTAAIGTRAELNSQRISWLEEQLRRLLP